MKLTVDEQIEMIYMLAAHHRYLQSMLLNMPVNTQAHTDVTKRIRVADDLHHKLLKLCD